MSKKLLAFSLLVGLFLPFTTLSLGAVDPKAVESIQMNFCNEQGVVGKKLLLGELEPNTPTEICLSLHNTSETDLPVITNFVDGVTTSDGEHIACRDETDEKSSFAKFVKLPEPDFLLPAGTTVVKKAELHFPADFSGATAGCFTYRIGEQTRQQGTLNVIIRKANIIQARVQGEVEIGLGVYSNPELNLTEEALRQTEELTIKRDTQTGEVYSELVVENTGNVKLAITALAEVTGPKIAAAQEQTLRLLPGETKIINSERITSPFLGGNFAFTTELTHEPEFDFTPGELETTTLAAETKQYQTKTFIGPQGKNLAILAAGGVFAVLVIFALIKFTKPSIVSFLKK